MYRPSFFLVVTGVLILVASPTFVAAATGLGDVVCLVLEGDASLSTGSDGCIDFTSTHNLNYCQGILPASASEGEKQRLREEAAKKCEETYGAAISIDLGTKSCEEFCTDKSIQPSGCKKKSETVLPEAACHANEGEWGGDDGWPYDIGDPHDDDGASIPDGGYWLGESTFYYDVVCECYKDRVNIAAAGPRPTATATPKATPSSTPVTVVTKPKTTPTPAVSTTRGIG